VVDVDVPAGRVTLGSVDELLTDLTPVSDLAWTADVVTGPVMVQASAHGEAVEAAVADGAVRWVELHRRIAPGQSLVFYVDLDGRQVVVGGATAERLPA
jgi:tRNA U34 2-thiouridine synthase MnmA/TrmU